MSDTIDRLVRILDEEREGHRRAREHEGREAMARHDAQRNLELCRKERMEARAKVEELERWIDALYLKVPEKDRKGWAKKPDKFDDIPF
jgi:hypothetical protein